MRSMNSFSLRSSASVGDSEMAEVSTMVRTVMPKMSGTRKAPALAPPGIPAGAPAAGADTCMAAMPV
jgi:hypothetical protein